MKRAADEIAVYESAQGNKDDIAAASNAAHTARAPGDNVSAPEQRGGADRLRVARGHHLGLIRPLLRQMMVDDERADLGLR